MCGGVSSPFFFFFCSVSWFVCCCIIIIFFNLSEHACSRACARMGSGHTDTRGRARNSGARRQEAGEMLPPRPSASPPRYLGFSSAVSVTGVAGAAKPLAPGLCARGAQLCSAAAEAAVPSSCTLSPTPPARRATFLGRASPLLPGDSPGSGQRMPGGGQAGGSTSNLRLPSNLGRRSSEHMTFC